MKNRNYGKFIKKKIFHPDDRIKTRYKNKRIGQTNYSKLGQLMTIIDYDTYENVTIKFDDGTIVTGQRYEKFKKGDVVNPNNKKKYSTSINEYTMMFYLSQVGFKKFPQGSLKKYGMGRMELDAFDETSKIGIGYDGKIHSFRRNTDLKKDNACKNAGIKLFRIRDNMPPVSECSTSFILHDCIPFSKEYEQVLKDLCCHLEYTKLADNISFDRDKSTIMKNYEKEFIVPYIGQEFTNSSGERVVITRYVSTNEVYVKFDDGTEKKYTYAALTKKSFKKNGHYKTYRVGMENVMKCGRKAKIIKYRNCNDIDIMYEDGDIEKHIRYDGFCNGQTTRRKSV